MTALSQITDIHVYRRESDQAAVLEVSTRRQVYTIPMDDAKRLMLIYLLQSIDKRPRSKE